MNGMEITVFLERYRSYMHGFLNNLNNSYDKKLAKKFMNMFGEYIVKTYMVRELDEMKELITKKIKIEDKISELHYKTRFNNDE